MKISVVIISTILTLSVFLPFIYFMLNGTKNTSKTKKSINSIIKDNGIIYSQNELWRKNFIGISNDNKILTFIHSSLENTIIKNINLEDVKQCRIIKNNTKDKIVSLNSTNLEFVFKSSINPTLVINFFNIDDDLSEDFELNRIEKWHRLISNTLTVHASEKLAS